MEDWRATIIGLGRVRFLVKLLESGKRAKVLGLLRKGKNSWGSLSGQQVLTRLVCPHSEASLITRQMALDLVQQLFVSNALSKEIDDAESRDAQMEEQYRQGYTGARRLFWQLYPGARIDGEFEIPLTTHWPEYSPPRVASRLWSSPSRLALPFVDEAHQPTRPPHVMHRVRAVHGPTHKNHPVMSRSIHIFQRGLDLVAYCEREIRFHRVAVLDSAASLTVAENFGKWNFNFKSVHPGAAYLVALEPFLQQIFHIPDLNRIVVDFLTHQQQQREITSASSVLAHSCGLHNCTGWL